MAEDRVLIVGGGNAGLAAAYKLHKAGVPFQLLEATGRVGGRVVNYEKDDLRYLGGALFTEPQWGVTGNYFKEFGLEDKILPIKKRTYGLYLDNEVKYFKDDGNMIKAMLELKGLPKKLVLQGAMFLPKLIKAMSMSKSAYDYSTMVELSRTSVYDWCTENGGDEIVDKLIGPLMRTMVIGRSQDVCMAHPASLLKWMAGMDFVQGGLNILNEAIYERIKDNVRLNAPVEEILMENGEAKGVRLVDGEVIEASQVVCATDAFIAREISPGLPQKMRDELATCEYSSTWHYAFYTEDLDLPEDYVLLFVPESYDSICTTVCRVPTCEADYVEGTERKHDFTGKGMFLHTWTVGWKDDLLMPMTEEERYEAVMNQLQEWYPDFGEKCEFLGCQRYDRAINLEKPGQYEEIEAFKEQERDLKGLYYCGEYQFLIACTEGGWFTGEEAADRVIADRA